MDFFDEFLDKSVEGERGLCAAVIANAINDIRRGKATSKDRQSACRFISADQPMFRFYAYGMGCDPEWLAEKIWKTVIDSRANRRKFSPYINK